MPKGATRVVVLGVGSELRGDDAAGLLTAEKLKQKAPENVQVLLGGTAPENLTGEIKKLQPTHLIIIDAANMRAAPGTIRLIPPKQINGYSFSTHNLPLKVMIDFILKDLSCEVLVIAIQPASTTFGASVSEAVEQSAVDLAETIREVSAPGSFQLSIIQKKYAS